MKLTDALETIEQRYISGAIGYLNLYNDPETAITVIPQIIDTLNKSLQRSNDLISKITGNSDLMSFIVQSGGTVTQNTLNVQNGIDLEDPVSRERVRSAIQSILASEEFAVEQE